MEVVEVEGTAHAPISCGGRHHEPENVDIHALNPENYSQASEEDRHAI